MNFHEVYEFFRKIFLFLSYWLHFKKFSFFRSYIDFSFQKIFFINFHEVYEYFRNIFLFVILIFHFKNFFFMNVYEVYEYYRKTFFCHINFLVKKILFYEFSLSLWVSSKHFFCHIDVSFQKIFFMNFHEVYEFFRKIFLFLGHILIFYFQKFV